VADQAKEDFLRNVLGVDIAALRQAASGDGAGANEPDISDDDKVIVINVEKPEFDDAYAAALQGVSGGSGKAEDATLRARAIAEEAVGTHAARIADLSQTERDALIDSYFKFFNDAIQGLAAGSEQPKAIVAKAHAMALASMKVQGAEVERLEWQKATLPQPKAANCELDRGKLRGPANHVLCKTHGHVIDTDIDMVIAHSAEEYAANQAGNAGGQGQGQAGSPAEGGGGNANEPDISDDDKVIVINVQKPEFDDAYAAALQGASGGSGKAEDVTTRARAIAEEAVATHATRIADLSQTERDALIDSYFKFFNDAIQGLASGSEQPKAIVSKAHAMALASMKVQGAEVERLEWQKATLPQPKAANCELDHGKLRGPANHVLCKTHGHVIDTDFDMVIAHSAEEYRASHP